MPKIQKILPHLPLPIGLASGLLAGLTTNYVARNHIIDKESYMARELRRQTLHPVYDKLSTPLISIGNPNYVFVPYTPSEALARLYIIERVAVQNKESLANYGYFEGLTERLDVAKNQVAKFTTDWPTNAGNWYNYLYYPTANGPKLNARELSSVADYGSDIGRGTLAPNFGVDALTVLSALFIGVLAAVIVKHSSKPLLKRLSRYLDLRAQRDAIKNKFEKLEKMS